MAMAQKLVLLAITELADIGGWTRLGEEELGHLAGLSEREVLRAIADLSKHGHVVVHTRDDKIFTTRWISLKPALSTGPSTTGPGYRGEQG